MLPVKGRVNAVNFGAVTGNITYMKSWSPKEDTRKVAINGNFSISSLNYSVYDTEAGTITYPTNFNAFSSAEQFQGVLYTNGGQQIRAGVVYNTQQAPTAYVSGTDISAVTHTPTGEYQPLAAGIYYYTITRVTTYADGTVQETSPDSNLTSTATGGYLSTLYVDLTGNTTNNVLISLLAGHTWSGTNADGSTYTTNVYRASSNQPTWYFIFGPLGGSSSVQDSNPDSFIATNVQLDFHRDPPPFVLNQTGPTGLANPTGVLFNHQERMWCLNVVNNAATLNVPQLQLWWSAYGIPWSFDQVDSVTLIGNSFIPGPATTVPAMPFGNVPSAAVSLGSVACLFLARSMYLLYGNDPTNFIDTKAFDIGCVSGLSVANCQGVVFWLSEEGIYQFDGNAPLYIGEKIRGLLSSVPISDQQNAVGWFANRSYWLSFPATGITISYYLPTKSWNTPYTFAASAVVSEVSQSAPLRSNSGTLLNLPVKHNYTLGARAGTTYIDVWHITDGDLGQPISSTWQGGITESETAWVRKTYHFVTINAPVQVGTCQVLLEVFGFPGDNQTYSFTFDLSLGPSQVKAVPQAARGFSAQITCSVVTPYGNTPVEIYSINVSGRDDDQAFIQQT
jgi:hypothetical protein